MIAKRPITHNQAVNFAHCVRRTSLALVQLRRRYAAGDS